MEMREYGHGGDIYSPLEQDKRVLDFSVNLNPFGLPPRAAAALQEAADACVAYPDPYCRELCRAIADYEGVSADWVLCGNGAADLIYRLVYGLRPKKALVLAPTFSEYEEAVRLSGGRVLSFLLREARDFAPDEGLPRVIREERPELVFLCNPNNPTGKLMEKELLLDTATACAEVGAVLAVDECFLDFTAREPELTMKAALPQYPRLVVLKAFTKFFAMAGLRLGYLLTADETLRDLVWNAGQPWSVSGPAQRCGIAALGDSGYIARTRRELPLLRESLYEALTALPLTVYRGEANYLLVRSGDTALAEKLLERGILIRSCRNYHGLDERYYRFAVKTAVDHARLIAALRECLGEGK